MRADVDLTNFTAGELSPRMRGRVDVAKYWNGCESLFNFVTQPQGGATRRPGTMFVNTNGDQNDPPRLIPFIFSTVQAYVLELGPTFFRIYRDNGVVVSGGSPVSVTTPYQAADLPLLKFFQSADTLFICHPLYPTQALTRSSDTAWSIASYAFQDGPYLTVNGSSTTITASSAGAPGATVTLTASSIVGINSSASSTGIGFQSTDVGRFVRVQLAGIWNWLSIATVVSTTQVTAVVGGTIQYGAFGGLAGQPWAGSTYYAVGAVVANGGKYYVCTVAGFSATSGGPTGTGTGIVDNFATWNYQATAPSLVTPNWQLGKWSQTTGFPYCGMFWQGRMVLAGTNNQPNAIEGSTPNSFTAFPPAAQDGSVSDANAISWVLDDDQVNAINWLATAGSAQAMQLGIGTTGGEQILQGANTASALSSTNVQSYRETSLGSRVNVQPLRVGKSLLFPNRPGQKLHEWSFTWQVNGYVGPDIAVLGEHIIRAGLSRIVYQQSPHSVIWGIVAGSLMACTYVREQDIVALTRQQLGGQYYGAPPIVEDLAVIPSPDTSYDQLWLAVLRTVNGVPTRTIEVMQPFYGSDLAEDGWFLDCALQSALTYPNATATISGLTEFATVDGAAVWTGTGTLSLTAAPATALAIGQVLRMNAGVGAITEVLTTTTALVNLLAPMTGLAPALASTWSLTAPVSTISGMGYLAGETVGIVGDGLNYGTATAASSITLSPLPASWVLCGLPYSSALVGMPTEPAAKSGQSAQGKTKKLGRMYVRFDSTIGGQVGTRTQDPMTNVITDRLEAIPQRQAGGIANAPMSLFGGVIRISPTGSSDYEGRVIVAQTEPMPMTVVAIGERAELGEMGG